MIHCATDSLIGDSAVTRAPAGGLWAAMVPEVGTRGGMANPGPGARLASGFGGALPPATATLASCNPARAIFSLASASGRPTKLGMTNSGVFAGWAKSKLTFGEVNSVAPAGGTWAMTWSGD